LLDFVACVLQLCGKDSFRYQNIVGIQGTPGVFMGYPCLGYQYWVILTGFVFAFPNPFKIKWLGFLLVTCLLVLLNISRLTLLCIYIEHDYNMVISRDLHRDFNQVITFFTVLFCLVWSSLKSH
jgi:exosortase/archaeosortase family protein